MNLRWHVAQFCEIRWWRRYLARRDKTVYLDWKRRYWLDFLQKSGLHLPPNTGVLDAGCGPAGIFMILHDQTVDALDPLLHRYEILLPHFRRSDYPQVRFFNQRLEDFFPDRTYDLVFCLNAINHVADLPHCLDRLAALTRPGGVLALSVDAHNFHWIKRLFRLLPADILHPHQYDLEEYRAMLTGRGFVPDKTVLMKKGSIFSYHLLVALKA
ncbi:MAG TPA: class I SAM-dependent methyltransferase [Saprospiraceae bacterium]|nr:class I SAM-dependent methyltransferase [Saprospiraceae bacterium]